MKLIPERKINHCKECIYNAFNECHHPFFDSVMYISKEERSMDFPPCCPLEDVKEGDDK